MLKSLYWLFQTTVHISGFNTFPGELHICFSKNDLLFSPFLITLTYSFLMLSFRPAALNWSLFTKVLSLQKFLNFSRTFSPLAPSFCSSWPFLISSSFAHYGLSYKHLTLSFPRSLCGYSLALTELLIISLCALST